MHETIHSNTHWLQTVVSNDLWRWRKNTFRHVASPKLRFPASPCHWVIYSPRWHKPTLPRGNVWTSWKTKNYSTAHVYAIIGKDDKLSAISMPLAIVLNTIPFNVCTLREGDTHQARNIVITLSWAAARMRLILAHGSVDINLFNQARMRSCPIRLLVIETILVRNWAKLWPLTLCLQQRCNIYLSNVSSPSSAVFFTPPGLWRPKATLSLSMKVPDDVKIICRTYTSWNLQNPERR